MCIKYPIMSKEKTNIIKSIQSLGFSVLPNGSKLVLFGSQARGDERSDSDWDLLILIDDKYAGPQAFGTFAYPFVEMGWDFGTYFSTKVYSFSEWAKRKGTPFYNNIKKEGLTLC